jgi:hypothetical protein
LNKCTISTSIPVLEKAISFSHKGAKSRIDAFLEYPL